MATKGKRPAKKRMVKMGPAVRAKRPGGARGTRPSTRTTTANADLNIPQQLQQIHEQLDALHTALNRAFPPAREAGEGQ